MHSRVIVVGSIGMDIVGKSETMPEVGVTKKGDDVHFIPGGKGSNQAVAASRLGADVGFIGMLGKDPFGTTLQKFIKKERIDTSNLKFTSKAPTCIALINVDKKGRNAIIVFSGSNWILAPKDIDPVKIRQSDIALATFESPQPTVLRFFERAKKAGAKTVLNAAPAVKTSRKMLSLTDYLILNEHEAAFYAARKVSNRTGEIRKTAGKLALRKDQAVVITLGENGAYCKMGSEEFMVQGRKVKVTDTTGAGDCFVGAFATAISEGKSLKEALVFANAAASIKVQRLGASSMPKRAEVSKIL